MYVGTHKNILEIIKYMTIIYDSICFLMASLDNIS